MSKYLVLLLLPWCILNIGSAEIYMECPNNERFVSCPYNECVPYSCLEVDEIIDCTQRSVCPSEPACMCVTGYARNEKGTCVSWETCRLELKADGKDYKDSATTGPENNKTAEPADSTAPTASNDLNDTTTMASTDSCRSDANATHGCDTSCKKRCAPTNYTTCKCPENSCKCKDGYVFDSTSFQCVHPEDCRGEITTTGTDEMTTITEKGETSTSEYSETTTEEIITTCTETTTDEIKTTYYENTETTTEAIIPSCNCTETSTDEINTTCKNTETTTEEITLSCDCADTTTDITSTYENITTTEEVTTTVEPKTTITVASECDAALTQYINAALNFSPKLLSVVADSNPGNTVAASGLAVMSYYGLAGLHSNNDEYLKQINLIGYKQDEVRCVLEKINELLRNLSPDVVSFHSVIGNKQYPFTKSFIQDVHNVVGGKAINMDLSNRNATDVINQIVASNTNGTVTNVVPSKKNLLSDSTQIILANGLYAKMQFNESFDPKLIKERNFYVTPFKIEKIQFYYQLGYFSYVNCPTLNSEFVQLKFTDRFQVILVLPYTFTKIKDVLKKMENPEIYYYAVVKKMKPTLIALYLPEMQFSTFIDIKEASQKTNTTPSLWDPNRAQLTNFIIPKENVAYSYGFQRINVEWTNEGAFPPSKIKRKPFEYPHVTDFNRPFVLCTFGKVDSKELPVFMGLFSGNK